MTCRSMMQHRPPLSSTPSWEWEHIYHAAVSENINRICEHAACTFRSCRASCCCVIAKIGRNVSPHSQAALVASNGRCSKRIFSRYFCLWSAKRAARCGSSRARPCSNTAAFRPSTSSYMRLSRFQPFKVFVSSFESR